jgi:CHRD domain
MRRVTAVTLGAWVACCVLPQCSLGQDVETFKARLTPVAHDASMIAIVAGSGSATARLDGSKLMVHGSFEGLPSIATVAHVQQGSATGVRGSKLFDLDVTKATSGQFSGAFRLTPEQVESLQKGKWYVQIYSEKAPDGNLWGWFLKGGAGK